MTAYSGLYDRLAPDKATLVVVDVQHDFCSPSGEMARRGRDVSSVPAAVEKINRLVTAARVAGVPVVFVRTTHSPSDHAPSWRYRCGTEDPPTICAENSQGADFYGVAPAAGETVVTKHRYSAFGDPSFQKTIEASGRPSLVFTGVATNVCVETSLRDAVCADFFTTLVEDACAAYSPAAHEASVANVATNFGFVTTTAAVEAVWSQERDTKTFETIDHIK